MPHINILDGDEYVDVYMGNGPPGEPPFDEDDDPPSGCCLSRIFVLALFPLLPTAAMAWSLT